jgi:hypothetical protein
MAKCLKSHRRRAASDSGSYHYQMRTWLSWPGQCSPRAIGRSDSRQLVKVTPFTVRCFLLPRVSANVEYAAVHEGPFPRADLVPLTRMSASEFIFSPHHGPVLDVQSKSAASGARNLAANRERFRYFMVQK